MKCIGVQAPSFCLLMTLKQRKIYGNDSVSHGSICPSAKNYFAHTYISAHILFLYCEANSYIAMPEAVPQFSERTDPNISICKILSDIC